MLKMVSLLLAQRNALSLENNVCVPIIASASTGKGGEVG